MAKIQIDMFEVQLGAAVLLQFAQEGGKVRVLADAGVKASGYKREHVRDRLLPILHVDARIDLIIGTHYDEDHLNGLVPVIEHPGFEIGEAWMPPVVNDTQIFAIDQPLVPADLLTLQLAREDGREVLASYLADKRDDIETIAALERCLDPEFNLQGTSDNQRYHPHRNRDGEFAAATEEPPEIDFFRAQLDDNDTHNHDIDHGGNQETEPHPVVTALVEETTRIDYPDLRYVLRRRTMDKLLEEATHICEHAPHLIAPYKLTLANLRKAAAKEAVNAKALHEVLEALAKRKVPVRSEIIDDGIPKRYRWKPVSRRFVLARPDSDGLTFTLLGPSRSLVKKHRERLPVLEASRIALAFTGEIRSITPSNQLSYIGCFNYSGQSILIAGDAGCVDFSERRGVYYPELLKALQPLHVIQVAHHGGNNAHFYRVLAAAGFPEQDAPSLLLLSHATHDKNRPSDVFREFLLTTLNEGDDVRLLFTSQPTRDKVEDFLDAIHPVVGPPGIIGDVRIEYDTAWKVTAHAIAAPTS